MAASFAAQLLDELMGRNRDANPNDKRRDIHWSDPEVCKYFICGICPHDLFTNTRSDLGACTKLHDESVKRDYERSSRYERMGYEEDLLKYLNTVIVEADRRILRGQQRLQMAAMEHAVPPTPEQTELDNKIEAIQQQMNDLVAEAESLGNEGMVDAARDKTTQCDQLRIERVKLQELRDKLVRPFEEVYKRRPMEVCDICGAMLFVDDAPQRLDDHIMGKQHMGYARIRSYIDAYEKKKNAAVAGKRGENGSKDKATTDAKVVDGVKEGEPDVDGKTSNCEDMDIVKDNDESCTLRTSEDKLPERRGGKDEDGRRRDERSLERKRDDRDRASDHRRDRGDGKDHGDNRHHHRADEMDSSSRRRSRDRDTRHPSGDRERRKSSEHSRQQHSGRSDRSRSRSRRSSHTAQSRSGDQSSRHRDRSRSRSRRRDGSHSRHGSRRSNHSRD